MRVDFTPGFSDRRERPLFPSRVTHPKGLRSNLAEPGPSDRASSRDRQMRMVASFIIHWRSRQAERTFRRFVAALRPARSRIRVAEPCVGSKWRSQRVKWNGVYKSRPE